MSKGQIVQVETFTIPIDFIGKFSHSAVVTYASGRIITYSYYDKFMYDCPKSVQNFVDDRRVFVGRRKYIPFCPFDDSQFLGFTIVDVYYMRGCLSHE